MPKKISDCTREFLTSIPLPVYATGAYTVISHESVINYSKQELAAAGFTIEAEEYRCTADGNIAQGVYKLHYNVDPEMSMMFAWTNSYNKQIKFKCAIGGYVNASGNVMLSGDMGTWSRKHTGNADTEAVATIKDQVTQAKYYYSQLVSDKSAMKDVVLNKRKQAQLLGILFAEYQILTTEQASIIRQQMDKPAFVFENSDSLWAFYNHVTFALQHSHPKTWMEDQRILHYFISTVANFEKVPIPEPEEAVVDPLTTNYGEPENQTNLLVQIAEVTGDESVLQAAQHPVSETHAFSMAQLAGVKAPESVAEELKETNPDLYHGLSHLAKAEADMLIHGDKTGFENISAVHEQALKDDLIYGVSGVEISAEGIRNVPVNEVLEKMSQDDIDFSNYTQGTDPISENDSVMVRVTETPAHEIEGFVMDDVIEELKEDLSEKEEVNEPQTAPGRVKFAIDLTEETLEIEEEVGKNEPEINEPSFPSENEAADLETFEKEEPQMTISEDFDLDFDLPTEEGDDNLPELF